MTARLERGLDFWSVKFEGVYGRLEWGLWLRPVERSVARSSSNRDLRRNLANECSRRSLGFERSRIVSVCLGPKRDPLRNSVLVPDSVPVVVLIPGKLASVEQIV